MSARPGRSWKIAPHPGRLSSDWWDHARASPAAPAAMAPLLDPMPCAEIRVDEAAAAAIMRWAAAIPGWDDDGAERPRPLIIEAVED